MSDSDEAEYQKMKNETWEIGRQERNRLLQMTQEERAEEKKADDMEMAKREEMEEMTSDKLPDK